MTYHRERRIVQILVALAAIVPVSAGFMGMLHGPMLLGDASAPADLDSHFRYLSGLLAGLGLAFWWMVPTIEQRTVPARVLTFLVVLGGLARLYAALAVVMPSMPMQLAIGMELIVTPLLCLWQGRIARLSAQNG